MKKLFFFRSHSSNHVNENQLCSPSADKQISWKKPTERGEKSAKNEHGPEDQGFPISPHLRRSRSFSSVSPCNFGKGIKNDGDETVSPYSSKQSGQNSPCYQTRIPERQTRRRFVDTAINRNSPRVRKLDSFVPRAHSDTSEISSNCSSHVLDLYIDGEQQPDRHESKTNWPGSNQHESGNVVLKRPPRSQFSAPVPCNVRSQKPKSLSFGETKTCHFQPSSNNVGSGEYIGSPRKLAKHVVERLSQPQALPKMRSKEVHPDGPITIEDVYGRTLNRCPNVSYPERVSPKQCSTVWDSDTLYWSNDKEILDFEKDELTGEKESIGENVNAAIDTDLELLKKFKEAQERVTNLSDDLVNRNFLKLGELSVPALIQIIRSLMEEKLNMAMEVSAVLEDRIAEMALFREKLIARAGLEAGTRRLEKEKNELQLALESELDRRSTEWSLKLEKYHTEEQRLRERVRELAEQNVNLQREVCSFSEREKNAITKITDSEKQLEDMSAQVKKTMEENHHLQKTVSEMNERTRAAEEERDCIRRNYEDKATEGKDLHQIIARLQRTCNDQERTITGLRELCEELGKKSREDSELGVRKLQIEHMRLTGVEHSLRKEVESCRIQVNSLRQENIDLLNRLKNLGKEDAYSTFKLDQELQNRISCLQNQMLPLLTESSQLGRRLLEFAKTIGGSSRKEMNSTTCFDSQFLVECEVKIQGLQQATENFTISMQTLSDVFQEKLALSAGKFHSTGTDSPTFSDLHNCNEQKSKNTIRFSLKAETLVTNLLREKLYAKEQETEQLQAELAAAVRGHDILKSEVQNAVDNISCMNHNMRVLELQMMKKDETINQLQGELQHCKKDLAVVKGVLPKVSEERDMMWEKVKQYSEDNMLLNGEVEWLRKKIEALDDDILLKEGQISILKDSMSKPFDLLATPEPPKDKLLLGRCT